MESSPHISWLTVRADDIITLFDKVEDKTLINIFIHEQTQSLDTVVSDAFHEAYIGYDLTEQTIKLGIIYE